MESNSNIIVDSRDIEFIENKLLYNSKIVSSSISILEAVLERDHNLDFSLNLRSEIETRLNVGKSEKERKLIDSDLVLPKLLSSKLKGSGNTMLRKILVVLNTDNDPKAFSEEMY